MRVLAVLVAVAFLFAGCLAAKPTGIVDDGKKPVDKVVQRIKLPEKIAFAASVVLGTMERGAEPSIAAAPDGTVYVTTPLALWRSDDGGKTYKQIGTPYCPAIGGVAAPPQCPGLEQKRPGMKGGGDADIHVTPDGRVHWLGLNDRVSQTEVNAIPYQVSEDKGETWSPVTDLAGEDGGDREWITSRADGTLFANWRNFPPGDSGRKAFIVMRSSHDGGKTWGNTTNIAKDTRQGGVSVDPTSNALALAHDLNGELAVAHSFDNGTTWASVTLVKDPVLGHVFPVTTFDANGTLYAAFAHDRDGSPVPNNPAVAPRPFETPNLYLMVSKDKGLTWSQPKQINAPGTTAWFPWIAAGAEGRVILVWYQIDAGYPRVAANEVYVMAGMSMDADLPGSTWKNVRIKPEPVHVGPECREITGPCTRSLLDFFEVAIHPKGYPVVTWAQDTYPVPRVSVAASYLSEGPNFLE